MERQKGQDRRTLWNRDAHPADTNWPRIFKENGKDGELMFAARGLEQAEMKVANRRSGDHGLMEHCDFHWIRCPLGFAAIWDGEELSIYRFPGSISSAFTSGA